MKEWSAEKLSKYYALEAVATHYGKYIHPKMPISEMKSDFSFQITEITRYEASAINQELFDKILGEGVVSSEEEFRAFIKKQMENQFAIDSEYKLTLDLRAYLTERIGKLEFPEATLKRIMKINNEDKDDEYIEKNFAPSLEELTWHLIKEQLSEQLEIKVEQDDILESAKVVTRLQFAQYGMMNIPEDILLNYAKEMLKNKQQVENMVARTVESKIAQKVMEVATLNRKTISLDEFNKMFAQEEEAAE
jgi:trigger factor